MNDHQLDTRARAAAGAIHHAVAGVAIPSPTPARPRRRMPARPALAFAALVVVALVAGAVALGGGDPSPTDVATDATGGIPRLVLEDVPEGLDVTGAVELPLTEGMEQPARWSVYGDPGADNPFEGADLGVAVLEGAADYDQGVERGREVEVGGRRAWLADEGSEAGPVLRRSLVVPLEDDLLVAISATLDDDALLDVGGRLGLDDGTFDAPDDLTDELSLVAASRAGVNTGGIAIPLPAERGSMVGYQSQDDLSRSVSVMSVDAGEDDFLVARWALGPGARPVDVRGTTGWVGSPFGAGSHVVVWRESESNVVALLAGGLSEDEVLAAAESLREATDDEWESLRPARQGEARVPPNARAAVSGRLADGSAYAAYVTDDGSLCLALSGSETCQGQAGGDAPTFVVAASETDAGEVIVYGWTTLGAPGQLEITADGEPASGPSEASTEDGATVFAFVDDVAPFPTEVVVRDRAGTELGRAPVNEAPSPILPD